MFRPAESSAADPTPTPSAVAGLADQSGFDRPLADHPLVRALLGRCRFPEPGTAVVCGVSGGADSVALMVLAVAAGLDVTVKHVDHGLRVDSDSEADMVQRVSAAYGVAFESLNIEVAAGPNLEARARTARHVVLGPGALFGHTADDQAETVLINLARGAGPQGLGAMRPGGSHPILALRRAETEALCAALGIEPFQDPSNDDPRFVRNRVRNELLPLLADIAERDPVPLLVRTADHARSLVDGVNELAGELDVTNTAVLRSAPPFIARAALRQWLRSADGHPLSTAALERVWDVVEHRAKACELSGGRRLSRTRGRLRLDHPSNSDQVTPGDCSSESVDGSVA